MEVAARAALESVENARALAAKAKSAAGEAAKIAASILKEAGGDKARANQVVEVADEAEKEAGEAFHRAEAEGVPKN